MKLPVIKDDIERADFVRRLGARVDKGSNCPAAYALKRLGYTQVYVGENFATVRRGDWRGRFALPAALTEQIVAWDVVGLFQAGDFDVTPVKLPAVERRS